MTDDKKEDDWGSAIDEWEKAFVPEVAQDKETKKAATLSVFPADPIEKAAKAASEHAALAPQAPVEPLPEIPAARPLPVIEAPAATEDVPAPARPSIPRPAPSAPRLAKPPVPPAARAAAAAAETARVAAAAAEEAARPATDTAVTPVPPAIDVPVTKVTPRAEIPVALPTRPGFAVEPIPQGSAQASAASFDDDAADVDVLLGDSVESAPATEEPDATEVSDKPEGFDGFVRQPSSQFPAAIQLDVSDVELVDSRRRSDAAAALSEGTPAVQVPPAAPVPAIEAPVTAAATEDPSKPIRFHDPDAETFYAVKAPKLAPSEPAPAKPVSAEASVEAQHASPEAEDLRSTAEPPILEDRPSEPPPSASGARAWIAEEARPAYAARADWLEAEARATADPDAQSRALLAVSEIRALLGETSRAHELALLAKELGPTLPLAHKQARGIAVSFQETEQLVVALDHETATMTVPAARTHSALFAADVLRLHGDETEAAKRWEQVSTGGAGDGDVRIAVARATHALAKGDLEAAARVRREGAGPIAEGLGATLRVRGYEGPGVEGVAIEGALAVNDALRRSRNALDAGNLDGVVDAVSELTRVDELAASARWFAAALGQTRSATRPKAGKLLGELVAQDELARRTLAGCAVELGDAGMLQVALQGSQFSVADRAVLAALLDLPAGDIEPQIATLGEAPAMAPLASAIAGTRFPAPPKPGTPEDDPAPRWADVDRRASRVAGGPTTRGAFGLARLVANQARPSAIEGAVDDMGEGAPAFARAVAVEMAVRGGRLGEVSDALKTWTPGVTASGGPSDHLLAAGLVAERASDVGRALNAYREARSSDASSETLLRVITSLDSSIDPPGELNQLADELGQGMAGALARLEAVVREKEVDDRTRSDLLERAHRAAPELPMPAFMAEHLARRSGDVDEVLRWVRERRAAATDPLEQALDNVREALLVADQNHALAAERLEEAHRTRPTDVALRELYERLAPSPPEDRGAWREQRAAASTGDAKALYYMEAAHEYERAGDRPQALRAALAAAAASDSVLARLTRERAEVEGGQPARLADELLAAARATENVRERREAYERLADLDATARADASSAVLWHRSILEDSADYKPSLRHIEQTLISAGRDDELDPIASGIARALRGAGGGEGVAHAGYAARLRSRGAGGDFESTLEMAQLAAAESEPSLASLRLLLSHARSRHDDKTLLTTILALVERTNRPFEISSLLVRAAETAVRLNDLAKARELLERAKNEDPADVVTWRELADVRKRVGDMPAAAEAWESLARTSTVTAHKLAAWHDAGHLWLDDVHDDGRAVTAFEQAANLDVTYKDVFPRLSALYTKRGAGGELAALLERRVATITDPDERVTMEVERGRALIEVSDLKGARTALEAALAASPDHTAALGTFADLCSKQGDWEPAEQAWVRLARLLTSPEEQRDVYARLGELYSVHAVNLSRAELAWKEVLKRAPGDIVTLDRLVDVHKRQNDAPRAAEIVQQLAVGSKDPAERRRRLIELAQIHEAPGKDLRKAEQVLESARREAPTDVTVLRALAEFYLRHKQGPAVQILLDRAAADARRAFAAGRFAPALFEVMRAVFELRGKKDAAEVVAATLAALDGHPANVRGGNVRALDPKLDDLLAPEAISPSLRVLLQQCGDALDIATPFDQRAAQAAPLQAGPLYSLFAQLAQGTGLSSIQLFSSAKLARSCVALGSSPPTFVIGEGLAQATNERARAFLILRAIKLSLVHASALVRAPATEVVVLVSAWLQAFNPSWVPDGVNATALAAAARRVAPGMPQDMSPDAGVMALEVAGSLGAQTATLGASTLAWANRAALLALGDPNAALDAVAWTLGKEGAPTDPKERASWVVRTREASDLLAFSVSEAYAEARSRLGLDK